MVKLQHYVPRSYLRHFACEGGKTPKIWCFDKALGKAFKTSVKNVGGENFFYHSRADGSQPIEKLFGRMESAFATSRSRLLAVSDAAQLGNEDRAVIALFFAAQMLRTREHRQQTNEMMEQIRTWALKEATPELQDWLGHTDDEQARRQHVSSLLQLVPEMAEMLLALKWVLLFNHTGHPFWTSDHPVTLFNPVDAWPRGNLGLKCEGIQAFLPISPWVTLSVCDPVMYGAMPPSGNVTAENVAFQNHLEVRASTQYLFASTGQFTLAEEILADEPDLRDPNRRRVQVAS